MDKKEFIWQLNQMLADLPEEERAEAVKAEIEELGGTALLYQCNVADFAACEEFL